VTGRAVLQMLLCCIQAVVAGGEVLRLESSVLTVAGVLVAAIAGAQPQAAACSLPAEPAAIPAAIDAAITGPADKDRTCMKQLFLPEARLVVVASGADGATTDTVLTLDDWIARVRARGNSQIEEKQLKFRIDTFGSIAHLWSTYAVSSDGKQAARGINSIQAVKVSGGWRVLGIMWQAESAAVPLPKEALP
jgi:Putative lumazine-binding